MFKNSLFNFTFKIVSGFFFGLIFPVVFILLDLNQLDEQVGWDQVWFVIYSQNIYFFSIIIFPLIFTIFNFLFYSVIEGNKKLQIANVKIIEEQKKNQLNEKLASIGVLAAGIAHEINNPMAIIKGNFELLKKYFVKLSIIHDIEIEKRVNIIELTIDRITKIVSGLKILSRTEQVDDDKEIINTHQEILQTFGNDGELVNLDGIKIHYKLNSKNPFVIGSTYKFQQIITNFISNSKDAIFVMNRKGVIEIESLDDNEFLILVFSDNGCGISKENLKKIFDAFFTTKPVGKGVGLGLSICHSLIKDMDGKLEVHSEVNNGSTFKLKFPSTKSSSV